MNSRPVAVITGASRGIGRAIAFTLAAEGYDVAGISRKPGPEPRVCGGSLVPFEGDIADMAGHELLMSGIAERFGRVDVVVSNAGVAPHERKDLLEVGEESYDRVMDINLKGAFFFTQAMARWMLDLRDKIEDYQPCIVFITSISAAASSPDRAEYCISKAGLSMAAQLFSHRLAGDGIPVYEVRPGLVETDMTKPVKKQYDRLIEEGLVPQKRWGQPYDVSRTVSALVRGELAYTTGAVIELSGGMNIRRL